MLFSKRGSFSSSFLVGTITLIFGPRLIFCCETMFSLLLISFFIRETERLYSKTSENILNVTMSRSKKRILYADLCFKLNSESNRDLLLTSLRYSNDISLVNYQHYLNLCAVNRRMTFDSILLNICASRRIPRSDVMQTIIE